jgi:hypothetical protein
MTIADKIIAQAGTAVNMMFDKEPLNYVENAALYAAVLAGRQNVATLAVLYNHARDGDLRALLKRAIDEQTEWLIDNAEKTLAAGGGELPDFHFTKRPLSDAPLDIPESARFSDQEIALLLANIAKTAQMAVLGAMHNCYQPYVAKLFQDVLDKAADYNFSLMQLVLHKGWLPHLHKLRH